MDIGIFLMVLFFLGIGVLLFKGMQPKKTKQKKVCADCGSVAYPDIETRGSFGIELLLWLFFLLPGIIYSVWRLTSRHEVCPACGSTNLVPINTPRGKKLAEEFAIPQADPAQQTVSRMAAMPGEIVSRSAATRSAPSSKAEPSIRVSGTMSPTVKALGVIMLLVLVPYGIYTGIAKSTTQRQPEDWKQHGSIAVAAVKIWRNNLKDPDSAKIRSAVLMPSGAWCFDLGAKNGFGAYDRNYMLISPNGAPQFANSLDGASDFGAAWNSYCDGTGKEYANVVQASL